MKKPTTNYTFPDVLFRAAGGRRPGRSRDRAETGQTSAEKHPVLNLAGKRAKRGAFSNKKWCFPVYLGLVKSL